MASTSKQDPPRRLAQFLQEQQEPFVLEIYLLERGCRPRSSTNKSNELLKRSSNIARTLYEKLVSINQILKVKNSEVKKKDKKGGVVELENRISSASSSTLCNTCSESDIERESLYSSPTTTRNTILETAPDRIMTKWRIVEENKQCSPVYVLDEIDFLQGIPVFNETVKQDQEADTSESRIEFQKKVSEDSILSASLWDLLLQSRENQKIKKNNKRSKPLPLSRYISSKKALQQTRQLLFDCVREVVEGHNINGIRKEKGLMGPEEIGRIMCNNLKSWGKESFKGTKKISQLLRTDLMLDSPQEWWGGSSHHEERREIAFDIGDALLQVITDEIVTDMIDDQATNYVMKKEMLLLSCSIANIYDETIRSSTVIKGQESRSHKT